MSRLSFEKKRAQRPAEHRAAVPVRVFGAGGASVGGTSVAAVPGEEIHQTVLNRLQRLAISLGAPIRATIQDDRVGLMVPLEVSADGSSRVMGEPVRTAPPREAEKAEQAGSCPEPKAGTARVPTGQFGPPPVMDAPVAAAATTTATTAAAPSAPSALSTPSSVAPAPEAAPLPTPDHIPAPAASSPSPSPSLSVSLPLYAEPEAPVAAHTPARGFDAVAEEVLGDGPLTETAEGAELLTEPMTRINEAVRAGRIEAAAELTDRTVTEASTVLGPGHAEVLHLRELSAYIAYLGGEPVRAFEQSLDLARLRRQARDAEAAYGNVRSAATAWRAVRDPEEGLRLGRDLIELWTDLSAEPGPAADDLHPLESARARMGRLTDRAARAAQS
ncbi:hypothetical protein ACIQB5_12930 [Streptomyces sp. NPDC088560]|uniref:hypothetical protein n=1 Tax=Streptomyces sp. NPDC088560 TaxID=3365868 RepID=UPI00381F153D